MTVQPGLATKKPVPVDFMRWPGGAANATPIIDWILANGPRAARYWEEEPDPFGGEKPVPEHIVIDTLEGQMWAVAGDVIIRGVKDEFYPCKPDIFAETYDITTEGTITHD